MPSDPPPNWLLQQRRDIGTRVRAARVQVGLTQEGLAGRIHVERRTIVRIELGITSPSLDRVLRIAHELGVPPAELMPQA